MNSPKLEQQNLDTVTRCSIDELHRRADLTSKIRYRAARRLLAHNSLSQWTLSGLAIAQIVISAISALKLPTQYSVEYYSFGGIFFGVLVLAYSLLIGMADYSARSVRMHKCGLDLGELARNLYLMKQLSDAGKNDYEESSKKYYIILGQHENHSSIDYLGVAFERALSDCPTCVKFHCKSLCGLRIIYLWLKLKFLMIIQFSHYLGTLMIVWAWIYWSIF